ncbi:hypothetical protein [Mucilaginibacter xinganensis]|uniref:Uncharacterized protein n=1 Tax=Mucilaginibacter xinganensis TaxID=1234841 RepID=A0A223NVY3_9SPHI|nr:hypothetical protein [Mucilaginibacter xinganensis]ASU33986.1 hypothetical protein MuYL_2094 [Mucilaginibacter xinganensis]
MINQTIYIINTTKGELHLTITPIISKLPTGDFYETGVYKLTDGVTGMGEIAFDENRNEWTYDGIDELNWEEAAEVAAFIKNYKDPAGADPDALQS